MEPRKRIVKNRINCRTCIHFFITWDPDRPYGCRAMGFKTKGMPSYTVARATGKPCELHTKKPETR